MSGQTEAGRKTKSVVNEVRGEGGGEGGGFKGYLCTSEPFSRANRGTRVSLPPSSQSSSLGKRL